MADGITGRHYLERGQPVTVVVQWRHPGQRNVLIRRVDGSLVVRPFRGLRRARRGPAPRGTPGLEDDRER